MKKNIKKLKKIKPVTDFLSDPCTLADNELEHAFKQTKFQRILQKSGIEKRSGDDLVSVLFTLLIWPLLGIQSISLFCGKKLNCFIKGGENVLYEFMKRQNINWRKLRINSAKTIYKKNTIDKEQIKAYVFDDTIKHRRGKKVEASSWHFDHTDGRSVQGQQVLEMGLVTSRGYLPIDSQIYVSSSKAVARKNNFDDNRSAVALDYKDACELDKNRMMRDMLKRSLRAGIKADYVIADSWFGNKGNIYETKQQGLTGLFRMKCNSMNFRIHGRMLSDKVLYYILKKKARPIKGMPWKVFSINVELNFEEESGKKDDWQFVKLVFSVPKDEHSEKYGLFLCTDIELDPSKVLEIYSLRWSIEVYFKEVKQNMGFLAEQTGNYVVHYASIHLSAIRYMLFTHSMMQNENSQSISTIRTETARKIELLSYANILWELFKALIHGALDSLLGVIGESMVALIKSTLDSTIMDFLEEALQLDKTSFEVEVKAEKKNKKISFYDKLASTI